MPPLWTRSRDGENLCETLEYGILYILHLHEHARDDALELAERPLHQTAPHDGEEVRQHDDRHARVHPLFSDKHCKLSRASTHRLPRIHKMGRMIGTIEEVLYHEAKMSDQIVRAVFLTSERDRRRMRVFQEAPRWHAPSLRLSGLLLALFD